MKHIRLARLALALTPLALGQTALPAPAPAQAPMAAPNDGLPPGTPPLTAAQRQKQAARAARYQQDFAALQSNAALTPKQKQQQSLAMQKSLDDDMLAILTPAQQAPVLKQRKIVTGLRAEFDKQHQGEADQVKQIGAALQKSITPQQKQKMSLIQQQVQAQIQKLGSDTKTPLKVKQQEANAIERDAVRQQLLVMNPTQQAMVKQVQAIETRYFQELAAFAKAHGQR